MTRRSCTHWLDTAADATKTRPGLRSQPGSGFHAVTECVLLVVAVRGRRRVPRVQAMCPRLCWFAGLRKPYVTPYARRASSLASRFRLPEATFVTPVRTAQMISSSQRGTWSVRG